MGCGTSSDAQSQLMEQQRQLQAAELKNHEQQNLLRFKVEVLVNMLSVEEKKNELNAKRIETLKWLLYSQGVTEEALTNVVAKIEAGGEEGDRRQILQTSKLLDLSGALQRMRQEFLLFKESIVRCLASAEGKLIPSLPAEEFMKQVFGVTEHISKHDLWIVALRFDDGYGSVNVPDFLDFFATPVDIRTARSAANAVRMSLDLLELDVEGLEAHCLVHPTVHSEGELSPGEECSGLDRGARRLVLLWPFVAEALTQALHAFQPGSGTGEGREGGGEEEAEAGLLSRDRFERTLAEICGRTSPALQARVLAGELVLLPPAACPPLPAPPLPAPLPAPPRPSPAPRVEPLDDDDIDLVTERFELHGHVHVGHFVAFFGELAARLARPAPGAAPGLAAAAALPAHLLGTSPFRDSVEWRAIREDTLRRSASEMRRFTAPRQLPPGPGPGPGTQPGGPDPGPAVPDPGVPVPAAAVAAPGRPSRLASLFLCGGRGAAAGAVPDPVPPAKETTAAPAASHKDDDDDEAQGPGSESEGSEGSAAASQPKQDSGFHTPRLRGQPRRVQLPPEDDTPAAKGGGGGGGGGGQRNLARDPLGPAEAKPSPAAGGAADKAATSSASRFRRRTAEETPPPSAGDAARRLLPSSGGSGGSSHAATPDASLHQIRQLRHRMDHDDDDDDDDDDEGGGGGVQAAVSRVHGNVRGVGRK